LRSELSSVPLSGIKTCSVCSSILTRLPDWGRVLGDTPELYFTNPDGILLQLQDMSYCGGDGYLG